MADMTEPDLKPLVAALPGARRATIKVVTKNHEVITVDAKPWLAAAIAMLAEDEPDVAEPPFEAPLDDAQADEKLQDAAEEGFGGVDDEPGED